MAVSYSRQIPPGGTGEITLKIKTDGKAGETVNHHMTIYTNDPNNASIVVNMTGDILAPAEIDPIAARLIGPAGSSIQTDIKITPAALNPFAISGAKAINGKNITLSLEKKSAKNTPYYLLHITNQKKQAGRYTDKIKLSTTSTISPELEIRVYGIIR